MPEILRNPNTEGIYREIINSLTRTIEKLFQELKVENPNRRLVLLDKPQVVEMYGTGNYDLIQKMRFEGKTVANPVFVTVGLYENDKLVQKARIKLFDVPVTTPNYGYIYNGIEYVVINQLRLEPGVYIEPLERGYRVRINNAAGLNFYIEKDPETNIFYTVFGSTKIKLYPILNALGVPDSEIAKYWGKEYLEVNKNAYSKNDVNRFGRRLNRQQALPTFEENVAFIKKYFKENTKFNPEVNKLTLGLDHDHLTPELILKATQYLIRAYQGDKSVISQTENLAFKSVHSIEKLLSERLELSFKNYIKSVILNRLKNPKYNQVEKIIPAGIFNVPIESFFTKTPFSRVSEQINVIEPFLVTTSVTIRGPGGIEDEYQTPITARTFDISHVGFLDLLHTPDKDPGSVLRLSGVAYYASDKGLVTTVYDLKTKKTLELTPKELYESYYTFESEYKKAKDKVNAFYKSKIVQVPKEKIRYLIPDVGLFGGTVYLIPFSNSNQGNRLMMGAKMISQALALVEREKPLVMPVHKDSNMWELLGKTLALKSPVSGTVKRVTKDSIEVVDKSGKKYEIPLRKNYVATSTSYIEDIPVVKEGQKITEDDVIAVTNFHDEDGHLAIGKNLKFAFMPYDGYTLEDGIIISESAAKKLSSLHIHEISHDIYPEVSVLNRTLFMNQFRGKYPLSAFANLDSDGVIKKGSKVKKGDIIIAYAEKYRMRPEDVLLNKFEAYLKNKLVDKAAIWDKDVEGEVIDVIKTPEKVVVLIKTVEPAKVGDKLANLHGNKGIITKILPDNQMPHDEEGKPVDVILNPFGVISRLNLGQLHEGILGKIARKTNKTITVPYFTDDNYKLVEELAKKHNIKFTENLTDPSTGKKFENVFTGVGYFMKLVHQVDKKFEARDIGVYSAAEDMPSKIGSEFTGSEDYGAPRTLDKLTMFALLSHGAKNFLREAYTYKSQKNPEVWQAIIDGTPLPPLKEPNLATKRLFDLLRVGGVETKKIGNLITFQPLTDKDVEKLSSGELPEAHRPFFVGQTGQAVKGGLFDPYLTGGMQGMNYNHIELGTKVLNPVAEKLVTTLLDLTSTQFEEVISGKLPITKSGESGQQAILKALKERYPDIDKAIKDIRKAIENTKDPNELDRLNKKLKYLLGLKTAGLKFDDLFISKVLVIPPKFRPVLKQPDGSYIIDETNYIYRYIANVANYLKSKDFSALKRFQRFKTKAEATLYNYIKHLQGWEQVEDLTDENITKLTGAAYVAGTSPEEGYYNKYILRKRQDWVGGSVISLNPTLGVNEVGIPREMALNIFRFMIANKMRKAGYKLSDILNMIKAKDPTVMHYLDEVVKEYPVLLNRAPSLHKGSIMAFKVKLHDGKTIQLNPLALKGFNADFDGDQMMVHVPITPEGIEDARRMLYDQNIVDPKNYSLWALPQQEYLWGIYAASIIKNENKPIKYESLEKALEDYKAGKLHPQQAIKIKNTVTSVGFEKLREIFPEGFKPSYGQKIDKKALDSLLLKLFIKQPEKIAKVLNDLKEFGRKFSTEVPYSFSYEDIKPVNKNIKIVDKVAPTPENIEKVIGKVKKDLKAVLESDNRFALSVKAGLRGSEDTLMQLVISPLTSTDIKDQMIPFWIKNPYSKGLTPVEFVVAASGARKGLYNKTTSIRDPGALSKAVITSIHDIIVTVNDCGTRRGLKYPITDKFHIWGRVLAEPAGHLKRNTILMDEEINELIKEGVKEVVVRSPMTCEAEKGVCAMCWGINEKGKLPAVGEAVGVKSAQAIMEPLSQEVLSSWHRGGTVTGGIVASVPKYVEALLTNKAVVPKATLATKSGKVKSITKDKFDNWVIDVDGTKHVTALKPKVKVGDKVEKGDPLTVGLPDPLEFGRYKGIDKLREMIKNELKISLSDVAKVHDKHIEVIAKAVTNYHVIESPGNTPFVAGDYIPESLAKKLKQNQPIPIESALGFELAQNVGGHEKGTVINAEVIEDLKKKGIKEVKVNVGNFKSSPTFIGVDKIPAASRDVLHAMALRDIKRVIREGALRGFASNIHGLYPEPGLTWGIDFGHDGQFY